MNVQIIFLCIFSAKVRWKQCLNHVEEKRNIYDSLNLLTNTKGGNGVKGGL